MKSATDKIQIFKPDSIARKIGGDTEDVLAVMRACFYKAADNAMEWALRGDHTKPWPLETAENRGDALVDHLTAAYCASLHAVTVGKEDIGHVSKEVHLRDIRAVLVKPGGFERRQFWREEIARWLQAMELGSEYAFAADSETPPINGASNAMPMALKESPATNESEPQEHRQARRYQACIDAGLKMPNDDYSHLPRGIGKIAKCEGITRQAFTDDVKAHIRRINGR